MSGFSAKRTTAVFLLILQILSLTWTALAKAEMREPINTSVQPSDKLPRNLEGVGVDAKLGAPLPLNLNFQDESGRTVRLADIVQDKPVLLTLAYFKCPSLCTFVLTGLVDAMKEIHPTLGKDYRALTVSISPKEGPRLALAKKRSYLARYARFPVNDADPAWSFLTGQEQNIQKLAHAAGFHYLYDSKSGEYSHASVVMVLTPEGRMSQYFYGIHYPPRELEQAIAKASRSGIGSPLKQILLYCFHYDASTGQWTIRIMGVLRILAGLTIMSLIGAAILLSRKERAA